MVAGTDTSGWLESVYRGRLGYALEIASSLGIEYGNRPMDIIVRNPRGVLERIEKRTSSEFIEHLNVMAKDLFDTLCAM